MSNHEILVPLLYIMLSHISSFLTLRDKKKIGNQMTYIKEAPRKLLIVVCRKIDN